MVGCLYPLAAQCLVALCDHALQLHPSQRWSRITMPAPSAPTGGSRLWLVHVDGTQVMTGNSFCLPDFLAIIFCLNYRLTTCFLTFSDLF